MRTLWQGLIATAVVGSMIATGDADDGLKARLKDTNASLTDIWVYNDIQQGMDEARRLNKPLFVTFRCVPCKDCAAFDADVASGNAGVRELAKEKFVSVRQVEMKGVDLSLFQFDHDLNWAGMFLNADGVVYARYGTQSSEGSDAYNSIEGLTNTMQRVLELHAEYPHNQEELKGKRGPARKVKSALELPGLRNPAKYAQETTRQNCIHCHNIHDAEHQHALDSGTYSPDLLLKYPLPDNIGLKIDRKSGIRISEVIENSAAAAAGLKVGEEIVRMEGQPITSIADMQWVLHHLPLGDATVRIETSQTGMHDVKLKDGWKKYDFSWRGSMWNAPPRFQAWVPILGADAKRKLGLPEDETAMEVRWINLDSLGGKRALDDGLREKDVIIALDGKPFHGDTRQFNMHVKLNYRVGDDLSLTVLRNGQRQNVTIHLVE
ncbi:Trx7/PDZ domain-containing (seleno)protein [Schlesneria sp.]|uniref:Trx7/PDZ domain-containing (seleno)protein n=1 Tax=Schlesneria sp. TaxID=2762018 RepID=UPI002F22A6C4